MKLAMKRHNTIKLDFYVGDIIYDVRELPAASVLVSALPVHRILWGLRSLVKEQVCKVRRRLDSVIRPSSMVDPQMCYLHKFDLLPNIPIPWQRSVTYSIVNVYTGVHIQCLLKGQ